jgi:hypothetical protein
MENWSPAPEVSRTRGAALDLGTVLKFEAAAPPTHMSFGMPTKDNGNQTMQCPYEYKYCLCCARLGKLPQKYAIISGL